MRNKNFRSKLEMGQYISNTFRGGKKVSKVERHKDVYTVKIHYSDSTFEVFNGRFVFELCVSLNLGDLATRYK